MTGQREGAAQESAPHPTSPNTQHLLPHKVQRPVLQESPAILDEERPQEHRRHTGAENETSRAPHP